MRIRSIRHKGLKRLIEDDDERQIRRDLGAQGAQQPRGADSRAGHRRRSRAARMARPPAFRRITFALENEDIFHLNLEDYH
jgi:hypothetical protein